MDNNELNNNTNNQPNIGGEILMGDAPVTNINANMQPQNNLNLNQGIGTVIQNNINQTQPETPTPTDTIFSDVGQPSTEPLQPVQEPVQPQPVQEPLIPETPKEKKGKGPIIIILLLLVVLGLAGYIVYDKYISKEKTETTTKEETKKDTKIVEKLNVDDFVYTYQEKIETNGDIKLQYKIPNLNIESEYAKTINNEILEKYKDTEKLSQKGTDINYSAYINNNILSLVIYEGSTYSEADVRYVVYNIDAKTGKKVTNTEILKSKNITFDKFKENVISTHKILVPEDKWSTVGNTNMTYADVIKEFNERTIDNYVIYLNSKNEICVINLMQTIPSAHYSIMNLNTNEYTGIENNTQSAN